MTDNMKYRAKVAAAAVLAVAVMSGSMYAGEPDNSAVHERPKIGVVLSGGGAKGSAHIGVLKVLEEVGIPVDYVAGTSMGSIIGGLYCLGYSPEEMDSLISTVDWSVYMSNSVTRDKLSFLDKEHKGKYMLTIPFTTAASLEKKVETGRKGQDEMMTKSAAAPSVFVNSLPAGFISGNNVENLLNSLCLGYQDSIDFNRMPIPYACVAVDMVTGEEIVFRSGYLSKAIRASMAIPGVFAPVRMGDMVLVDGGMLNNFPVDVCREMGADIIIGVRVSSKLKGNPEELNSLPQLIDQLMGVVTKSKANENIAMCDIFIEPDVSGYGPMSFDSMSIDTLIKKGYDAADSQRESFIRLRKMLEEYGPVEKRLQAPKAVNMDNDTITISSVSIRGVGEKDAAWLLRKSRLLKNRRMTGKQIEQAVSFFYGTNAFSKITYTVHPDEGDSTYNVRIDLVKDVPHNFGFGFRFDSQEAAAILLGLGINEQKLTGVKFNFSTRLSYNPWATVMVSFVPRAIPRFNLSYTFRKSEANIRYNGLPFASTMFLKQTVKAYFSEYHSRFTSAELGLDFDNYIYSHFLLNDRYDSSIPGTDSLRCAYMGLYATLKFDSKDRSAFPSSGVDFVLSGGWKFHDFYGLSPFSTFGDIMVRFAAYMPFAEGRLVLSPQVYGRFVMGEDYLLSYENLMGGAMPGRYVSHQLPFIGANRPEIMFNSLAILRADLRWNVHRKHYLTFMGNYAREGNGIRNFFTPKMPYTDNLMTAYDWWGVGIRYSYDLPIGPFDLDVSWSNITKTVGVYVNLGYYF